MRPQCGFLRCSAYYNIVFDEKDVRHAYPTFQREVMFTNMFVDFPKALGEKEMDKSGWYEELFLAEMNER